MTVAAPELPDLVGRQEPTIRLAPAYVSTSGPEAIELAATAGLILDPWQQLYINDALGERANGLWAAFEAAIVVARQNGKGGIFECRALAGLFLLDERLIMYSAHEFKTAAEMFRRIEELIAGTSDMRRRVKRVTRSHGEEGIELVTGQRLRFFARSTGSGRGFSGDCNIWDEVQHLGEGPVDAMLPTMSARPNPQLLYGGSAPDKDLAPCDQIARVRRRALKGDDPSLVYHEYSADLCTDECSEGCTEHDDPADPQVWAKTNPGLGIRISVEHVARERVSMSAKGFARERLSVGNWPSEHADQWSVISERTWRDLADATSQAGERVAFAVDATPGGTHAAIGVAGVREDGLGHVEVVDHRRGTGWVVDRIAGKADDDADEGLVGRWGPVAVVIDPGGPAGFLIPALEEALTDPETGEPRVKVIKTSARDVGAATDGFIAACGVAEGDEATLRVVPHPALDAAVAGADVAKLGDGRKWNRRNPSTDISPLVAGTLARWGLTAAEDDEEAVEPWASWG